MRSNDKMAVVSEKNGNVEYDNGVMIIDEGSIKDKIHIIRGVKVMLDYDLAEIYGYQTKDFNRQVKNNMRKFEGEEFMFRITREELNDLVRCKNSTSRINNMFTGQSGGTRYLPNAFTEQGVYMLMTVLKGDLAIRQSRSLIMAFKSIKDYVIENQDMIGKQEYLHLSMQVSDSIKENLKMRSELFELGMQMSQVMDKLSNVVEKSEIAPFLLDMGKPAEKREYLFLNGQPAKANMAYLSIYGMADRSIHIVDDYIGMKTLYLLQDVPEKVRVTIISDNIHKRLHLSDYQEFIKETPNLSIDFIKSNGISHDRFIILDYNTEKERVFHCGASSKDAGYRTSAITEFLSGSIKDAFHSDLEKMLSNPPLELG